MAFANIDLETPVLAKDLPEYSSGVGQIDVCPTGVVTFGIAQAALTKGATVYVTVDGKVSADAAATSIKGIVQCDAAAGDGVHVLLFGLTSGENPAWVLPALGA